jgi:hypothetical protein
MNRWAWILLLVALAGRGAGACEDLRWSADSISLCGATLAVEDLSPGYAVVDACAWGGTAIAALGRPGQARGEIVRAFRFENGAARVAWTAWMQRQRPWRVRAADIDGDGAPELAVGVFNKARFHPVDAERLFIYTMHPDGLSPMWLGSRLSRPLASFEFADTAPGLPGDELVAVERNADGSHRAAIYAWNGFGFTVHAVPIASFAFESMSVRGHAALINNHPLEIPKEAP